MDALSHILDDIHLYGSEFLYVVGHGEWGFELEGHATFHVLLQGTACLEVADQQHTLNAGDIAFIAAGAEHRLVYCSKQKGPLHNLADDFQGHCVEPIKLGQGQHRLMIVSTHLPKQSHIQS